MFHPDPQLEKDIAWFEEFYYNVIVKQNLSLQNEDHESVDNVLKAAKRWLRHMKESPDY